MQADFWLEHWRKGRIGFHRDAPQPLLVKHWPSLQLASGSRVLVPLAGKTQDMMWLLEQGHRVLGVELSPLAVEQFLAENRLQAQVHQSAQGRHFVVDDIEIIQGDVFALADATLASCDAVYDRAAIVALPATMRARYAREIHGRLPAHCRGLMISFDYDQNEMDGPPFAVPLEDVIALLGDSWQVTQLQRDDSLAAHDHFAAAGLSALHTLTCRLDRQS